MELLNWTMKYGSYEPLPCQAPCSLYSVLLAHQLIPDPFDSLNDQKLTALSDIGCSFETHFTVNESFSQKEYAELCFDGLDTLCTIYLNGRKLASVQNMHRGYSYDVRSRLISGENTLLLVFDSPTRYFEKWNARHPLYSNDGCTIPGAAHLRKAFYMSGWDWAPTLPDMGIWKPVRLISYDQDRIVDVDVRQNHHDGIVEVTVSVETARHRASDFQITMDGQTAKAVDGEATISIRNPKLWWVRGYGDQPLYEVSVQLLDGDTVLDRCTKSIGLRTLTVSTKADEDGKGNEFCFVINGVKIFAMGANYVPQDSLLSRVTHEKLDQMMQQCLDANFNSLRVWGGGVYPDDYFYELCDRNGILVWQDFMLACVNVWLTEQSEMEYRAEAEYQLKRLRHHPSLGLICGNNEMESAVLNWGICSNQLVREDYIELYERILPRIAEKLAPDVFYWPSSPCSGGGLDDPDNPAKGDVHYWEVWHGGVPFTAYRQKHFRFCSEYGFESFPSMKTIRTFAEETDLNCFCRVMEDHQKCHGGNTKILRYLADNYLYPHSFEKLVYASQLLQADAIKYGVQHFRRERGYCMGSMYWQFNDCWPVASWSSVDYFGRYKALHYAARKFYAPVALGLFLENGVLKVNVSNETMEEFRGTIRLSLRTADHSVLDQAEQAVHVDKLRARDVFSYEVPEADPYSSYLSVELLDEAGALVMRETQLMVPCKYFEWKKPDFRLTFADTDEGVAIEVSSDCYAQGVCIDFDGFDCVLSDNFFPLTDGKPYQIVARTDRSARELEKACTMTSVYDIR